MIDLTPLDVRNKRGDFKKLLRGYDPQEVDVFLELVQNGSRRWCVRICRSGSAPRRSSSR